MDVLKQALFVLKMNARALRQRIGTSLVIVAGIAGVVAVLISVLAMAAGLLDTLRSSARDDRAVVTRNGASDETSSILTRSTAATVMDAAAVKRASGKPIASAEAIVVASVPVHGEDAEAQLSIRGVGSNAAVLRPELKIVEGRMYRPGVNEIIVGEKAVGRFKGLHVGEHPLIGGKQWTVVGIFASASAHDSTLLTDVDTLMNTFGKNEFQSITVQLESAGALEAFTNSLKVGSSLPVQVFSEREFFERQSNTLRKVLKVIAYVVGTIMAFGAIFAALNIMYSAVSSRAIEIATLRAIGYGPDAMVIAVLVETLTLALFGGAAGALLSWVVFNGYDLSTISGSGAQLVFELAVTPTIMIVGIAWACVIGFLGGLWPALQAARLPVVVAMRSA